MRLAEAGRDLQDTLVELLELSLVGKQLHWTIFGRPFKPLHEHLDQLVDWWRDSSDTVAERVITLGQVPDGRSATVSTQSDLAPVPRHLLDTDDALDELVPRVALVAARVRARADRMGHVDLISQDVLIEVGRELEKQLWMLRSSMNPGSR